MSMPRVAAFLVSLLMSFTAHGLAHAQETKLTVMVFRGGQNLPLFAAQEQGFLAKRGIAYVDSPISGGVPGAVKATLAVMVSCPRPAYEALKPILENFGKTFYLGEKPGQAQTMKLANNIMSAAAVAITSEAVVMGARV